MHGNVLGEEHNQLDDRKKVEFRVFCNFVILLIVGV
jgi:hypothetical protein